MLVVSSTTAFTVHCKSTKAVLPNDAYCFHTVPTTVTAVTTCAFQRLPMKNSGHHLPHAPRCECWCIVLSNGQLFFRSGKGLMAIFWKRHYTALDFDLASDLNQMNLAIVSWRVLCSLLVISGHRSVETLSHQHGSSNNSTEIFL